jgi:hypothetical protein
VSPDLLDRLLAWPHLSRIHRLVLAFHNLGNEGAQRLASSPSLAKLRSLSLRNTNIGDTGGLALAESPYLNKLDFLELQGNTGIGPDTRVALQIRFGDGCVSL